MTYLDPHHDRIRADNGKLLMRTLILLGVLAFGVFAVTLGTGNNGTTYVVPEPITRSF
jgi:hypothetical protein